MAELPTQPKPAYWTTVGIPLSEIVTTIINKVDRDKRSELLARSGGMCAFLLGNIRVAWRTYQVIQALAKEHDKIGLGLEVAVAIPPLARVILESMFSVMYVFEDPAGRLPDFWKKAWAAVAERHEQAVTDHGNDPRWADAIRFVAEQRAGWEQDLAAQGTPLTAEQLASPSTVRWPNPGKMPRKCADPWRSDVLAYLDARYYGQLSIASHLSGTGILLQAGHLQTGASEHNQRRYISQQFAIAFTMMMSLVAVYAIDVIRERDFARRVVEFCTKDGLPDDAKEVYARCFKDKLEQLAG